MKKILLVYILLAAIISCKKEDTKPGEVSATIQGFIVEDSFTGQLTCSGYDIMIADERYQAVGEIPKAFTHPNAWPASVWVRYQRDKTDPCTDRSNRIVLTSVRQR